MTHQTLTFGSHPFGVLVYVERFDEPRPEQEIKDLQVVHVGVPYLLQVIEEGFLFVVAQATVQRGPQNFVFATLCNKINTC